MKSAMPFLGIPLPEVRRITRSCAHGETDAARLRATARALWDHADYREERYAALALLALPPLEGDPAQMPLIVHFVHTGAWWDFTDELAHRVAALHDAHPAETATLVRTWCTDGDVWLRRLAILSQLGAARLCTGSARLGAALLRVPRAQPTEQARGAAAPG